MSKYLLVHVFWRKVTKKGASVLIGYARVSTHEQNFDLQLDALKKAGCEKIFQDAASGTKGERKGLVEALGYVRDGDTLVVWRLDRLGRSLGQLIELTNGLQARKVSFKSLVEAIDTTTTTGQFFFHVTGAFAELERNLIRERTKAGLEAARARGRTGGRPKAIDSDGLAMALELYASNKNSVESISRQMGIAKRTLYRYLERHKATIVKDLHPVEHAFAEMPKN
jgi:DNA invertase Pin-like site-specific DNA recombinase